MLWILLFAVVVVIIVASIGSSSSQKSPPAPELKVSFSYSEDFEASAPLRFEWTPRYFTSTSLEALLHAGEVWEGDSRHAPKYGQDGDGYWRYISRHHDEAPWSEIGSLPADGGPFRDFLIEFREIVEGDGETVSKIRDVEALCARDATYTEFADRIGEKFPYSWFASLLTVLPSVGQGTAEKLFDAGFLDLESVRAASDPELTAIHGIGAGTVAEIRKYFASEKDRGSRRRFSDQPRLPPGDRPKADPS